MRLAAGDAMAEWVKALGGQEGEYRWQHEARDSAAGLVEKMQAAQGPCTLPILDALPASVLPVLGRRTSGPPAPTKTKHNQVMALERIKLQPDEEQADTGFEKGASGPSPDNLEARKDSMA
jgi:hypothetical protein